MKNQIQLANADDLIAHSWPVFRLLFYTLLGCSLAVSSVARAVTLPVDGDYPNQNTAVDDDALFSLTTGADNTPMGLMAFGSNTNASDAAPESWMWIWRASDSLASSRIDHTAILLPNGSVLVAGGYAGGTDYPATAELYSPASRTWTVTGRLNAARAGHTATLLSNGMVLVAGGYGANGNTHGSAELYDPATGTWSITGKLHTERKFHTATCYKTARSLLQVVFPMISRF